MVWATEKPSLRLASCCSVEVVNGFAGERFVGFFYHVFNCKFSCFAFFEKGKRIFFLFKPF
jgi:hypothetical protein